ncbi:hypothetical protein L332_08860 [Agrococcus pavilionensis RW1]|uniref:Polysaccharide chain length determinant N-terminal domain-containing protein n=1 Tax=Agrococcus pavilionensis RW1 TaxID=1330458 RepID=U1MRI0_9MICO|nr:hypothetical protein L332_08860 [Agrococcus pavilionensis RW1]
MLDVIRALVRRWYFVVLGAVLTAALTVGAYVSTPPEYSARALVLLLPSDTAVGEGGNPLLSLSGLEQPAGILVAYFNSDSATEEVERQSATAEYLVAIDESTRGPVVVVDVTDADPQRALDTLGFLLDRIPEGLATLQAQVAAPADAVITSMPLTVDERAEPDFSGTIRVMIAALVLGIALTCTATIALDGLLRRREMRPGGRPPEPRRTRRSAGTREAEALEPTSRERLASASSVGT